MALQCIHVVCGLVRINGKIRQKPNKGLLPRHYRISIGHLRSFGSGSSPRKAIRWGSLAGRRSARCACCNVFICLLISIRKSPRGHGWGLARQAAAMCRDIHRQNPQRFFTPPIFITLSHFQCTITQKPEFPHAFHENSCKTPDCVLKRSDYVFFLPGISKIHSLVTTPIAYASLYPTLAPLRSGIRGCPEIPTAAGEGCKLRGGRSLYANG